MGGVYMDVRYALRMLLRNRGFTIVTALTLALGIGANSAGFELFDAIVLRPLPVNQPQELALLNRVGGRSPGSWFSYSMFKEASDFENLLSGITAFSRVDNLTLTVDGVDEQLYGGGQIVSGDYYRVLGVKPTVGRLLTIDDDNPAGTEAAAVISYKLWVRRFNRDPSVQGKDIRLNGAQFTIVGVSGPDFYGVMLGDAPEITIPLNVYSRVSRSVSSDPGKIAIQVLTRLSPGVYRQTASAMLNTFFHEQTTSNLLGAEERIELQDGSRGVSIWRDQFSAQIRILMFVVWSLLLLTCANVASLLLSRTVERQKEIAVRVALGAGSRRIIRQLLTEGLALATLGGALALFVAYWFSQILLALITRGNAREVSIGFNSRMFVYTGLITLVALLLFGIAPAFVALRSDIIPALKGSTVGQSRFIFNRLLLAVQVVTTFMVLVAALVLLQSVKNLMASNTGFLNRNLILVRVDCRPTGYKGEQVVDLFARLKERIETVPGVVSASWSMTGLFSGQSARASIFVQGTSNDQELVNEISIGPGFFETVGLRLVEGRDFDERDIPTGPRVAVVNEAMARQYFAGQNAIGKQFGYGKGPPIEIVGMVNDAKYGSLREVLLPMIYLPYRQSKGYWRELQIRTVGDPSTVSPLVWKDIKSMEPNLVVPEIKTLDERIDESITAERFSLRLSIFFGLVALLLAGAGTFGLASRSVVQRMKEIGIRIALGAAPSAIFAFVLRETIVIALAGVAIGVPGAFLSGRVISALVFGLGPTDIFAMILATLLILGMAALAALGPAMKATRVDPCAVLSCE